MCVCVCSEAVGSDGYLYGEPDVKAVAAKASAQITTSHVRAGFLSSPASHTGSTQLHRSCGKKSSVITDVWQHLLSLSSFSPSLFSLHCSLSFIFTSHSLFPLVFFYQQRVSRVRGKQFEQKTFHSDSDQSCHSENVILSSVSRCKFWMTKKKIQRMSLCKQFKSINNGSLCCTAYFLSVLFVIHSPLVPSLLKHFPPPFYTSSFFQQVSALFEQCIIHASAH